MNSMKPGIDQLKISRSLSIIENDTDSARKIIGGLPARDYCVIGVTGSPGAGKSSLTDRLACISVEQSIRQAPSREAPFSETGSE